MIGLLVSLAALLSAVAGVARHIWIHRKKLRRENVAGASAFHAVGGFSGRSQVHTSGLVEAGGNLPVMIVFVDFEEHVDRVLPGLRELAPHRLIVREHVTVEQSNLE